MIRVRSCVAWSMVFGSLLAAAAPGAAGPTPDVSRVRNLLLDATLSSNIESLRRGLRGAIDHMVYDTQRRQFAKRSEWHEYGVRFGADLGVVAEGKPVWWMAEWPRPVEVAFVCLTGTYDNQPQPRPGPVDHSRAGHGRMVRPQTLRVGRTRCRAGARRRVPRECLQPR
jgi:hypothetical protein